MNRNKFIQITGVGDKLFALDSAGVVWVYIPPRKAFDVQDGGTGATCSYPSLASRWEHAG